jgi:aspartate beta-hydroxylase
MDSVAMSLLSSLPRARRVVRRHARRLKYQTLWARLLCRAAAKGIPPRSLGRVHTFLRSYYDKSLFPHVHAQQNPHTSYFPGLRACAIYDPQEIAWTALLERAYPEIRPELLAMIGRSELGPHPQGLADTGSWQVKYLYLQGEVQEDAHRLCPNTSAVLKSCLPRGPCHQVFCSILGANSHIAPHCGPANIRLTCHLGLVVPPGPTLRVGSEVVTWQEGKCLVFDDSFEHEAWNRTDAERAVLLIQFWHPDLTEAEVWALKELYRLTSFSEYTQAVMRGGMIRHKKPKKRAVVSPEDPSPSSNQ